MNPQRITVTLLVAALWLIPTAVRADDVCEPGDRQAGNAQTSRALAAEAAGNLREALQLAQIVNDCADDYAGMRKLVMRASQQLGREAEAAGDLAAAFDFYASGHATERYADPKPYGLLDDASRVAFAMINAQPTDRAVARQMLEFMNRESQSDDVARIQQHIHAQARRLLAEEAIVFTVATPHTELLEEAEAWLQQEVLTGVPESTEPTAADLDKRWVARGDAFAALDYYTALSNAINYYGEADQSDRQQAVQSKARKIADGLANGNDWGEAVRLYDLAGDSERAEALTRSREASAADVEADRKARFDQEQDDLEKELGF